MSASILDTIPVTGGAGFIGSNFVLQWPRTSGPAVVILERTILWKDADIAIPWPASAADVIMSEKDKQGARLRDAEVVA